MKPIVQTDHIFEAAEAAGSVLVSNPFGRDVLITHVISGEAVSVGGFCTLYQSPDGVAKVAHQGGADAVGVKTANQTTSYSTLYRNVGEQVIIDLAAEAETTLDGTHDVSVTFFN